MQIFTHTMQREKSDDWLMWLVFIPVENAYFKIAGARSNAKGTIYEKYSKNGKSFKEHETDDPENFAAWFEEKFGVNPLTEKFSVLSEDIKLARHSRDTKHVLNNLKQLTGKEFCIDTQAVIKHYSLI